MSDFQLATAVAGFVACFLGVVFAVMRYNIALIGNPEAIEAIKAGLEQYCDPDAGETIWRKPRESVTDEKGNQR